METTPLLADADATKAVTVRVNHEEICRPAEDCENERSQTSDREISVDLPKPNVFKIVCVVSIGVFLGAADSTIVIASYSRIGSDLNALNLTSWIALGYYLTLSTFQPLYGKLSDIFGRKECLLFSYVVFGTGCLLCGLSQSIWQLFAARLIQGVGGGGMTTLVTILISDLVSIEDRGLWQGILNIVYSMGAGLGGPIGGVFADSPLGWRWSFFAQVPPCMLAIIGVAKFLRLAEGQHTKHNNNNNNNNAEKLARVDFMGAISLFMAVVCFLVGLDRGGNAGWNLPTTWGPLVAFPFLASLFIFTEARVVAEPFVPLPMLSSRRLLPSYVSSFCAFGANLALVYFLSMYWQTYGALSAVRASVLLIPGVAGEVIGTLVAGLLLKRAVAIWRLNMAAYATLAVGNVAVLLVVSLVPQSLVGLSICNMVAAFGNGLGIIVTLVNIVSSSSRETQAVATSVSYLFRTTGAISGVSITAVIIQNSLRVLLRQRLSGNQDVDQIVEAARRSLDSLSELDPTIVPVVRTAYGEAIARGFALCTVLSLFASASSFFLPRRQA